MFGHILYIQFHQMLLKLNVDRLLNFLNDLIDQLPRKRKPYDIINEITIGSLRSRARRVDPGPRILINRDQVQKILINWVRV